ncbi:Protein of unknown function DUF58 [Nakamurella panacisegetis]|uniref:DUF58 domain-containing protein n=1 Tax=Nakamurella panacisegetis TaxID=1090615 RepID=A0A1H0PB69_9ACTN|nr:DUF58 domain-containing protein [Nakamurella panacisegetis]SDP02000.1 Protein of unknown function DUF58 [Nakamurella panacisegetis]
MSLLAPRPAAPGTGPTAGGRRPQAGLGRGLRVVTPIGWTAVGAAVVFFAASRWTGWPELSVVAVALAAALVVASVFVVGRSRYRVVLDLRSERVVVGEPATGRMLVSNTSGSRLLPVRMELPVGAAIPSISIPSLAKDAVHEELFVIPTARRGVIVVGPARSVRGDAFGLFRRSVRWTEPELLYVHPRTVPLEGTSPGFIQDLEGEATKELSNNDVSFHALRGYVPGDDRRYIHWKTTARTGVVMVRQFEETRRSHLAVALSVRMQDYGSEAEFEIAVASAASLGVQAFREERAVSVVPGDRPLRAATARRLLDGIAGVEWSDTTDGVATAARNTAATVPDVSVAIVLCGSEPTVAQIRSAATAFPVGVRVVAVRVERGAPIAVRRVGSLPVLTIGALDDLARALRAVRA